MSTPIRPTSFSSRNEVAFRNSVIRRPMRECRKRVASPIRYNPMARCAPKEVTNAPKAKRIRQSRLHLENFVPYESDSPRPPGTSQPSPLSRFNLPIQRLQFDNEDFMDLYADDNNKERHRPDSVAFLSQCLANALNSVIMEPATSTPYISPRLSSLRPRSHLKTPEYRYTRKEISPPKLTFTPKMHADKEN